MSDNGRNALRDQLQLIGSLQAPENYPHPVSSFEVVETHISWVILTGKFAYKIKKSVDLGFLNFSTLERRRHFCEEELRLNAQWAPQLYLGVVAISGSHACPSLQAQGDVIEYAVKMRQFPQEAQLDRQLADSLLHDEDLCRLAETIAGNHEQARVIEYANDRESVGKVSVPILENFEPVERAIDMDLLTGVHQWTASTLARLKPQLIRRRKEGFVRECHGDLHLSNLVRLPEGIVAFDCIEFSEDLRNIDVLSDVAFLVMDLVARARHDLAYAFLNRYLERTGDYAGMAVFGLYFVYHSMIRAKVAAIRSAERDNDDDRREDIERVKHYLAVAVRWTRRPRPRLIAMHGYSGSGKTWLSSQLLVRVPAIRVRSDVQRKRLAGLEETASSGSAPGEGLYSRNAQSAVYASLYEVAGGLLREGFNVIVDASFLHKADREALAVFAERQDVDYVFVSTSASNEECEQRLRARSASGGDASEADVSILRHQLGTADPFDESETRHCIPVTTSKRVDVDEIIKSISDSA